MTQNSKMSKNVWLWPILYALGCNLFFFGVLNVTFLTEVKGLNYQQFFLLDVIGAGVDLLTAVPFLFLIAKIGNNASLRIATGLMLASACLFTFGDSFAYFALANVLYFKAYQFFIVYPMILENNLEKYGRKNEFTKYNARSRLFYSILALAVAFVAGFLFDADAYLPMCLCIAFAAVAFVVSFFVRDETGGSYDTASLFARSARGAQSRSFITFAIMFSIFVLVFKGCWYVGSQYTKVSLQEIGVIVETIAIVIFVARGLRVVINSFANKILACAKKSLAIILPTLLTLSLVLMAVPLIFVQDFTLQLIMVCAGVILLFSIHDLFAIFTYDVIYSCFPKPVHLRMFWLINLLENVGILLANILITCIIADLSVGLALLILALASAFCIGVGGYMYGYLRKTARKISFQDLEEPL